MQLWVQPSGSRLWQFAYRYGGRQRQLAFGAYPELSLAQARDKRTDAKKLLRDGFDPAHERRLREAAARAGDDTFRQVGEEYVAKREREGLAETTLTKKRWLLELADEDLSAETVGSLSNRTRAGEML